MPTAKRARRRATAAPILITGFDAFGGDPINPSWLAAERLHGQTLAGHPVLAVQLPTQFGASLKALDAALRRLQRAGQTPVLIVCLGLAASRSEISLERIGINVNDARIPDNAGQQPIDTPVVRGGPAAYFSSLPIKAIVRALQAHGLPAAVSQTAGTYVCNHVLYGLMHRLARRRSLAGVRGGFVHVPPLPHQAPAGVAGMVLDELVRGLVIALKTALTQRVDVVRGGGDVD